MKTKEALSKARDIFKEQNISSANLDAEVLLLESININNKNKKDKAWIYANLDYELKKEEKDIFYKFIEERRKRKPISYIIKRKEFYGIFFFVDENVLIPRPETEIIVEEVIKYFKKSKEVFTLIDIGTGSGCIPISILKQKSSEHIKKCLVNDISKEALKIAKINAKKHKVYEKIFFVEGDFIKAIDKMSGNLIITANLPYISEEEYNLLDKDVKYEPRKALISHKNGMGDIMRLIKELDKKKECLKDVFIILEMDTKQVDIITEYCKKILGKNYNIKQILDLSKRKRFIEITKIKTG